MQEISITETTVASNQQQDKVIEQPAVAAPFQFRAVALDLDGTLLHSNHAMSTASAEYLGQLHAKGIPILIATGRAGPTVMEHVTRLLDQIWTNFTSCVPMVPAACNVVRNKKRETWPSRKCLPCQFHLDITKRVIRLANKLGQVVQYYHGANVYANPSKDHHFKLARRYSDLTGSNTIYIEDSFESLLKASNLSSKLLVLCPEDDLSAVFCAFQQEFRNDEATLIYGATSTHRGWFLEILHPQVNKGTGLETMCAFLRISVDDVVAFGDGENDVEFLTVAGKGIAMKNAREAAKKVADQVIEYTNNEVSRCTDA